MKNRAQIIIGMILFTVTVLTTLVVFRQQAQDKSKLQDDDATPIQKEVMTEKQKKHSKLYSSDEPAKNLLTGTKDVLIIVQFPWEAKKEISSQADFLKDLSCRAGAIVTVTVQSKASQLTENSQFVFTDYTLQIKSALKNTSGADLQPSGSITLTTPGGAVKIENRIIKVVVKSNKRLKVGDDYLLFLDYLPDSDSFKISSLEGMFRISDDEIERYNDAKSPYSETYKNTAEFTGFIKETVSKCSQADREIK